MKINDSHLPTYFQTEFTLIEISQPKKRKIKTNYFQNFDLRVFTFGWNWDFEI